MLSNANCPLENATLMIKMSTFKALSKILPDHPILVGVLVHKSVSVEAIFRGLSF